MRDPRRLGFLWRHPLRSAAAFAIVVSLAGIFQQSVWPRDEVREVEMGREMLLAGGSARPTLGGQSHLEKPPLFFWCMAASFHLFGIHAGAARLPGALFSVVTILAASALARRAAGRAAGLLAALVVASFGVYWTVSHRAVTDVALMAFVVLGHLLLLRGHDALRAGRSTWAFAGAGACTALAFLTKGLVGPLLLVAPPLLAAAAMRDWSVLRRALPRIASWSSLALLALAVPWAVALSSHRGGWQEVSDSVFGQAIGRFLGDEELGSHSEPPWYYVVRGPVWLLPWTLVIPAMAASPSFRRWFAKPRAREVAWVALASLLLLSIPLGKRLVYLAPLLPAAAALPAAWLALARRGVRGDRITLGLAFPGGIALAGLALAAYGTVVAIGGAEMLPAVLAPIAEDRAWIVALAAAAAAVLGAWAARVTFVELRRSGATSPRLALGVAPLFGAAVIASHAVARPLLDPLYDLQPAAHAIAAAMPRDEPLIAYGPSEMLLGMVGFHTGRIIERAPSPDLAAYLVERRARRIVVEDKRIGRKIPAIPAGLRRVTSIRGAEDFSVTIFELLESRESE